MDRIFLAVIAAGILVIAGAGALLVFYKDDQSASLLRHPPGVGLIEPRQALPVEPVAFGLPDAIHWDRI